MNLFPPERPRVEFSAEAEDYPFYRMDMERGEDVPHYCFSVFMRVENTSYRIFGLDVYDDGRTEWGGAWQP